MWEKGISAFVGMGNSLETICRYLELARLYGYSRLFTSLHIPEANSDEMVSDFHEFVAHAVELGYSITADISPRACEMLGADLSDFSALKKLGLSAIRLDDGFSPEQIAELSVTCGMDIEINASTITPITLQQIYNAKADVTRLRACHNYYPRPETGLAFNLFAERCQLLRDYKIPVLAFVPSRSYPRGPIFAGLPTLEKHRSISPQLAAKELLASQFVDGVLFGDPLVSEEELASVACLDASCIELQVVVEEDASAIEREILFAVHTNRTDPGEWVIRSQEARGMCHTAIPVRTSRPRQLGGVTIDNQDYLRYMGEMQVMRASLPADPRVNVVAHIIPEELFLVDYIKPGGSFRFKEVTAHES
ncbi:DUF871 domain-containing protein [Dendrosporobacter sp. 1207_IL3150]|uniref:DUF871 domain-containing protein n=1 Tax=Dendrosporobacter sp. 1207_IL3150 TaxID=3084054 RepID=UPI002FD96590